LKKKNASKDNRTLQYVGCSLEFFIKWMEYNFDNNMSWDNRRKYWHIDHIMPCASYDLSKQKEITECYNWTNLRLLYRKENIEKSKKILKEIKYEIIDGIYVLPPVVKDHAVTC
jgi:hypothetical protein